MLKNVAATFFFVFLFYFSLSQISPKEGSQLNYRLVGFSFLPMKQALSYRLEIAAANYKSSDSFKKKIILSLSASKNKIIAEVPYFGCQYTWRVVYLSKNKTLKTSSLYHFIAAMDNRSDTGNFRLRIQQPIEKHKDYFVLVDGIGVLYDMRGTPVWYAPETNGIGGHVAGLKPTSHGTFTFIHKRDEYEMDYDGKILWHGPQSDKEKSKNSIRNYPIAAGTTKAAVQAGDTTTLPDGLMFVFMPGESGKLFITDSIKKTLWSAFTERYDENEKQWLPYFSRSASLISRKSLERLIWNTEKE